jgi:hypothetical protein
MPTKVKKSQSTQEKASSTVSIPKLSDDLMTSQKLLEQKASIIMRSLDDVEKQLRTVIKEIKSVYELVEFPKKRPSSLVGHGVRNYGFIEKCRDLIKDNPETIPTSSFEKRFMTLLTEFERVRQICIMSQELNNEIKDAEVMFGNASFGEALNYYDYLKSLARMKELNAQELVANLSDYFKKKKPDIQRPTEKQLKRDFDAIVHGKKDGKIVVENISPKKTKGVHIVEDDVYKSKEQIKVKVDEEE